jgi:hypothetical protein
MENVEKYILDLIDEVGEDKIKEVSKNIDTLYFFMKSLNYISSETPINTILNTANEFMKDLDSKRREDKLSKLMD